MKNSQPRGHCAECNAPFAPIRTTQDFCSSICSKRFNNRRMRRGAELYDLFMIIRHERKLAKAMGLWNLICRLAMYWKEQDEQERGLSRSWKRPDEALNRSQWARATIVKR